MILVTGGAGFIGANFVLDWLARSDEPVQLGQVGCQPRASLGLGDPEDHRHDDLARQRPHVRVEGDGLPRRKITHQTAGDVLHGWFVSLQRLAHERGRDLATHHRVVVAGPPLHDPVAEDDLMRRQPP